MLLCVHPLLWKSTSQFLVSYLCCTVKHLPVCKYRSLIVEGSEIIMSHIFELRNKFSLELQTNVISIPVSLSPLFYVAECGFIAAVLSSADVHFSVKGALNAGKGDLI